jgi:putative selenium metabolism protein SsnA
MSRTLVTHARLLTLHPGAEIVDDATLVLDADRITAILPEPEARDAHAEVVDAGGGLVLPGFVNAHAHHYSALARGLPHPVPPGDFASLLRHLWWRLDAALELEDVRLSAALAALDGLRAGVTTAFDHHASYGAIDGSLDAVAEGIEAAGQRGVLCYEVSDRAGRDAARAALRENERFATQAAQPPFVLGAMLGLHASFTLSDATLAAAADLARSTGLRAHVHVAEDPVDHTGNGPGSGVVARLEAHGLLGPGAIVAHALHLDAAERRRLGALDVFVAHNPRSNMNNGVGRAHLHEWVDAGVEVGLGTDGYGAGMLSEARVATLLQRQAPRFGDGALVRECLLHANPDFAARWLPGIGRLAPGSPADVVVTRYVPPTPLDAANAWGHLLFGDVEAAVRHVFVGGQLVLRDGCSTRLDEAELLGGCRERAARLWERFAAAPAFTWGSA